MNTSDYQQLQRLIRTLSNIRIFAILFCNALTLLLLFGLTTPTVYARPSTLSVGVVDDALLWTETNIAVDAVGAHSVKTADLDGDGDLDVITASRTDGNLRWYRNDGAAGFIAGGIDIINGVYIATPGDADADGDIDIFVASVSEVRPQLVASQLEEPSANSLGAILWYENDGQPTPSFSRHIIFGDLNYPVSLHVADLDGDGDLDAMSASRDDNRVLWYENNGDRNDPGFFPRTISDSALGAVSVHTADFDGDGDLDVVSASENDDQIAWYENQGQHPPQFTTHVIRYTTRPFPLEFDYAKAVFGADVDSDGDQDIVFGSENDNQIGWYENDGNPTPTFTPRIVSSGIDHVKMVGAEDLDLDGDIDLLSASTGDNTVAWFENDGNTDPNFVHHIVSANALGARFVHAADLDSDGDLDLLSASRRDNRITRYANNTIHRSAIFPEQRGGTLVENADVRMGQAGDLDDDGDLDVFSIGPAAIDWYENSGTTPPAFIGHPGQAAFADGRWVTVADLDSDGDQDFVYAEGNGRIGWQENNGQTTPAYVDQTVAAENESGLDDVQMVSVADIDADGDMDVYAAGGDRVVWYENRSTIPLQFLGWRVAERTMGVRSADAADLNGDGRLDLLSASFDDDSIRWYENLGSWPPAFREQSISAGVDGASQVHAADLDGDGDVDVLASAELGGSLIWFENTGGLPLRFAPRQIDAVVARTLTSSDLDHDGDLDIVAGLSGESPAAWYENDGQSPPTFVRHLAGDDKTFGNNISLADLDGDADADLLSVSVDTGRLSWHENAGGQYGIEASQVPSTWIRPNSPNQLLSLDLAHRGRPGDSSIDVLSLTLQFADADGRLLTSAQMQERFTSLSVYRAPCCGRHFDLASDQFLATVSPTILDAEGRLTIALPSGGPNLPLSSGEQATYFVTGRYDNACADGSVPIQIQVVITENMARDQESGLPVFAEGFRGAGLLTPARIEDNPRLVVNELSPEEPDPTVSPDGMDGQVGWFELFNLEYADVDLSGMYLTNDLDDPTRYRIPDGVRIPLRGHLLFIADGNPAAGPTHTSFRLTDGDEGVALYATDALDRSMTDMLPLGDGASNGVQDDGSEVSWGRYPDGGSNQQALEPTPAQPNQIESGPIRLFLTTILNGDGCPTQ